MKRIFGAAIAVAFFLGATYFVGSVISGSFDVSVWNEEARSIYGVLAVYGIIISAIFGAVVTDN